MTNLGALQKANLLNALDVQFARYLGAISSDASDDVLLAAALVSHSVALGHVCIDLSTWRRLLRHPEQGADFQLPDTPNPDAWIGALRRSDLVSDGPRYAPLVMDDQNRLYLRRYWQYQKQFADGIVRRIANPVEPIPPQLLQSFLDQHFPIDESTRQDPSADQRRAAETVVQKRFTVISGGPGTGKTTTVLRLLVLLQELRQVMNQPLLRCDLLAPTGKAAARLSETIRHRLDQMHVSKSIQASIPLGAATIHRRLGIKPDLPTRPQYHFDHPLPTDLVILDEASMVDLPLMAKLEQAVPAHARLVFLGDPDQLASVEVGAIFGDVCRTFVEINDRAAKPGIGATPLVSLRHTFRFSSQSGMAALADAVKHGDVARAEPVPADAQSPHRDQSVDVIDIDSTTRLDRMLRPQVLSGFGAYLSAQSPEEKLDRFQVFRILCALRVGAYGATQVNARVETILADEGVIDPSQPFYPNRPIMILKNDYQLGLFNGDTGLVVMHEDGHPRVVFPAEGNQTRSVNPAHLPPHETAYCLTIHKAQGSEFDQVFLLLPPHESRILTRELLYTGVTRARRHLTLATSRSAFQRALTREIRRPSGLREVFLKQLASGPSSASQ